MKRKVALLAGILALIGGLYIGARLTAQPPATSAPAPVTKVAVMNLPKVIKEYKKTVAQEEEIKEIYKKYEQTIKGLAEKIQGIKSNPPPSPERLAAAKEELKKLEREMADRTEERNTAVAAKSNEAMKILYQDVEGAVMALARSRNIELVFYYNDALDANSKYSPEVLRMKVGSSGVPIYAAPGLDITDAVSSVLDWNLKRNTSATSTQPAH